MLLSLCLLILYTGANADLSCTIMPGLIKQLDAGSGAVYAIDYNGNLYSWQINKWTPIFTQMIHVTVGPAGVFAVDINNNLINVKTNTKVEIQDGLKQSDAGGTNCISGPSIKNGISYRQLDVGTVNKFSADGNFTYYSCGPLGCWAINGTNQILYRYNTSSTLCQGTQWGDVDGNLTMVEVGTDGSVYGVDSNGCAYKRRGICPKIPMGTSWVQLRPCKGFKHLSYDSGFLWLITQAGNVLKCAVPVSVVPTLL